MFLLFSKEKTAGIFLASDVAEGVKIAVNDLRENLLALSGKSSGFDVLLGTSRQGIVVKTDPAECPSYEEGYCVTVRDDGVIITGYDILGTIYGVYAFATKCLGIDPMYRFTDIFPSPKETFWLEEQMLVSKKKTARFR